MGGVGPVSTQMKLYHAVPEIYIDKYMSVIGFLVAFGFGALIRRDFSQVVGKPQHPVTVPIFEKLPQGWIGK